MLDARQRKQQKYLLPVHTAGVLEKGHAGFVLTGTKL